MRVWTLQKFYKKMRGLYRSIRAFYFLTGEENLPVFFSFCISG